MDRQHTVSAAWIVWLVGLFVLALLPSPAYTQTCSADADCDDGLFCNGAERCIPSDPSAGANGCVAGTNPCISPCVCSEGTKSCGGAGCSQADADGDGHGSIGTGGDDCDDNDPNRYPGNIEVCDPAAYDEDCDVLTFGAVDLDVDGFVTDGCCNADLGGNLICGTDCDDQAAGVNPTSPEVCNGFDDNCDGTIDEGVQLTGYLDLDGDHWGDSASPASLCILPPTHAMRSGDCALLLPFAHPGATEAFNGVDDDCDGLIDEGLPQP